MRVLIIRHAVAVPRGTPDMADDERPLTRAGASGSARRPAAWPAWSSGRTRC